MYFASRKCISIVLRGANLYTTKLQFQGTKSHFLVYLFALPNITETHFCCVF